jgi:hypothetical protein
MAIFVKHEPCPRCGSRDNLARYSDGSAWCFGCHYRCRPDGVDRFLLDNQASILKDKHASPPDDLCNDFPRHVVEWLVKYDISIPEALKHGWKYSPSWNQLVFLFKDQEGKVEAWQARNFTEGKPKYYSQGLINGILPIFHTTKSQSVERTLLIVEDVISAARIAHQSDAMPCLGSHLPVRKINALKRLYSRLIVWLDHDKWKEACEIADKAKWLGMSARVVYTEKDPKEYSDDEIRKNIS